MRDFLLSRGWPPDWEEAVPHAVARGKREIKEDVEGGVLPPAPSSFAELHEYVDANEYAWGFEDPFGSPDDDDFCAFCNRVQGELDAWIKGGMR